MFTFKVAYRFIQIIQSRVKRICQEKDIIFHVNSKPQHINGLMYFPNYVNEKEVEILSNIVENNQWLINIRRRQQHYGVVYYHTRHNLSEIQPESSQSEKALDLSVFDWLIQRLITDEVFEASYPPNQCLVNEYDNKDKLGCHVENIQAFGPIIAGISLHNPSYLALREVENKENKVQLYLEPRSLYVLTSDSRYKWEHGVTKMKEIYNPITQQTIIKNETYRRVSLTFRHVLFEGTKKVRKGEDSEVPPNFFKKTQQL
ncbi:hypothetical protein ABPG72_000912 [Tetrahymena utriculariae]